jgi:putative hemolysin
MNRRQSAEPAVAQTCPLGMLPTPVALPKWVRLLASKALAMDRIAAVAESLDGRFDAAEYAGLALQRLGVSYALASEDLERVPATGGVIVVANHPYGGVDGLIGIAALHARRPDLKLLANGVLSKLGPLATCIIAVDPHGRAAHDNAMAMRAAVRHVVAGGALLIFPAGEVSHLRLRHATISDPAWTQAAARLVQLSRAPVVPMYFAGRNSIWFQLAGLAHPRVRTALLPRELLNKKGQVVQVRIGPEVAAARIARLSDAAAVASHLRSSVYLLAMADGTAPAAIPAVPTATFTVPGLTLTAARLNQPVDPERLARELAALPTDQCLAAAGGLQALVARAAQIPCTLQEIGRLREVTFRAVGEGTGAAEDLDTHDEYYEHLFLWHAQSRAVVGAYRIGRIDELRGRFGNRGLYLNSLFEFRDPFFALLGPALELGRSWVRSEFQRSYAPLLLLWRGISEYVGRHPKYARLIGPASVSNRYHPLSRNLLVEALRTWRGERLLGSLVRARRPFLASHTLRSLFAGAESLPDLDALSLLIEDREPDGKGVPVLLRQYLKLGARAIAFNVDVNFGDSLDCLILLDLRRVEPATLARYMSAESLQRFGDYWRQREFQQRRAG